MQKTPGDVAPHASGQALATHDVVIAGGGPTGLMLAGELALGGIDVAVVERRPHLDLVGTRAGGLHARSLEVLDQRGIADRFIARGRRIQSLQFAGMPLDSRGLASRHAGVLALSQVQVERLLADWAGGLGAVILRGDEVTAFAQDDAGVVVERAVGAPLRAGYLVGCDGGRSRVRKAAGIAFPGCEATVSNLIAEVEMAQEPPWGLRRDALGLHSLSRTEDGRRVRVLLTERQVGSAAEPTLGDLAAALAAVHGSDFGVHSPAWISRFTDATRQAATYRRGRVLVAGDAAHVHPPDGGQGLQTGLQDAVNLGWKLAQVIRGVSPDSLLDSYQAERHPVGARVLRNARAAIALRAGDPRTLALRELMTELLAIDDAGRRTAAMMSGLDIRYDFGDGHALLGRRMPDLDLQTAAGPSRVFEWLHAARPLLLDFGGPARPGVRVACDRLQRVEAVMVGDLQVPAVGTVDPPAAVLVRPDGHVAWAGEGGDAGLARALARWFGAPAPQC
jgi:2-polyprenyl-6-methoxyphenol hydroxylase-like FAD-dependent oxidoreductase